MLKITICPTEVTAGDEDMDFVPVLDPREQNNQRLLEQRHYHACLLLEQSQLNS